MRLATEFNLVAVGEGGRGEASSPNALASPPPQKKENLKDCFQKCDNSGLYFTSLIASESILEYLKSQIFPEGHAPSPPPPETTLYAASPHFPKLKILDRILT